MRVALGCTGREARFLSQLPVRKIPGIGEVTERALRALGIEFVHQLADSSQESLKNLWTMGTALYRKARGGDSTNLFWMLSQNPFRITIHSAKTQRCRDARIHAQPSLAKKPANVCASGTLSRTLTLTIRYAGFDTYTRSKTLTESIQFDADAFAAFLSLFREHRNAQRKVRLLGVAFSGSHTETNNSIFSIRRVAQTGQALASS